MQVVSRRVYTLSFTVDSGSRRLRPPDLAELVFNGLNGCPGHDVIVSDVTFTSEPIKDHPVADAVLATCVSNTKKIEAL